MDKHDIVYFLKDDIWKNFRTILNNATFKTPGFQGLRMVRVLE